MQLQSPYSCQEKPFESRATVDDQEVSFPAPAHLPDIHREPWEWAIDTNITYSPAPGDNNNNAPEYDYASLSPGPLEPLPPQAAQIPADCIVETFINVVPPPPIMLDVRTELDGSDEPP
jgi:hypothetical protein